MTSGVLIADRGRCNPVPGELNFQLVVWVGSVFGVVVLLSAAAELPFYFLAGAFLAGGLLLVLPFAGSPTNALVLALLFVVAFNSAYHPVFGFFSGLSGYPSGLFRYALGLRSAWFVSALSLVVLMVVKGLGADSRFRSNMLAGLFSIAVLSVCFLGSGAAIDARITYAVNSFLPLVLTVFLLGLLFSIPKLGDKDVDVVSAVCLLGVLAGALYFVLLPVTYDFFRPDLASFMRARPGEWIPAGGYDPSWGTRILGYVTNRFVGSFPDPIVAGYFFACLGFAFLVMRRFVFAATFGILLFLSLSKGAWLLLFQALVLYLVGRRSVPAMFWGTVGFVVIQLLLATLLDASNRMHFLGLVGGIKSVFHGGAKALVLGYGIGDGGNLGRGYLEDGALGAGWLGSGSESGVGVLVHQLGGLGVLALSSLLIVSLRTLLTVGRTADRRLRDRVVAVVALVCSWLANMPLQENCINASILSSVLLAALLLRSLVAKNGNDITSRPGG